MTMKVFKKMANSLSFISKGLILLSLGLMLIPQITLAADGDILTGWSEEGYQFKMQVISEADKTANLYGYYKTNYGGIPCVDENISGVITIPAESEGYKIVAVGTDAFAGCAKLTEVKLPEGIKTFGSDAFVGCYALERIRIPSTAIDLYDGEGWNIFRGCRSLKQIEVAEGNQYYDSRNGCNAIIRKNGNVLIVGCVTTVIPDDVAEIGTSAFQGQTELREISLPPSVKILNGNAFAGVPLTSIDLSNVRQIGFGVFQNCKDLTNVTFGDELETIGELSFYTCPIKELRLPNSLKTIGNRAFQSCTQIESLDIPKSVETIGGEAFSWCDGLKELYIPANIDTIGYQTFYYCKNVERITIGKNVCFIGSDAFAGSEKLKEVVSYIKEPFPIEQWAFRSRYGDVPNPFETAVLYVPKGTRTQYAALEGWKEFLRIKEFDPTANIIVSTKAEGLGSMSIGGIYEIGNEITLAASSEEGWMFKGWMIDGATVSTDVEYTLTVAEDITITAVFDKDPSAIQATRSEGATAEGYYSIDGKKQNTPQVGVNIVRMSDGTSRKILVK